MLHVHVRDKAGNEKDWTFGPFTYTPQIQVGQGSGGNFDQRYVDCYNRIGAAILGTVSNNYVHTATGSFGNGGAQDFAGGSGGHSIIMAKDGAALAFHVRGNIWGKYSGMSFAASPLGFPTSDEEDGTPAPKGTTGRVSHFEAGVITSTNVGTFEVHGNIFSKYANLAGSGGVLGFPTQDVMLNPTNMARYGTSGNVQLFEGGGIFESKFGTISVNGAIWSSKGLRMMTGYYGYPSQDEQNAAASPFGTSGRVVGFESGAFYNTAQYGVHGVGGSIFQKYAVAQFSGGRYGFPTSDAYDWNGGTRQDFEGGYITDGVTTSSNVTHILWTNTNGTASVWNLGDPNPAASSHLYGPYPGWTARAIAEGGDGTPRLLWTNTSGAASLWNLADANPPATAHLYGPYSGWTAKALTVGPDNRAHLLWNNTSGQVSLWNVDSAGGYTFSYAGPYAGWSGTAISYGADGQERLLWNNVNGAGVAVEPRRPEPRGILLYLRALRGWTAKSLTVGPDNVPHLLWNNANRQVSLWNVDSAGGYTFTYAGPYSGWSGTSIAVGGDNQERLLWNNTSGQVSVWNLSDANPAASSLIYGPYRGWSAVGISASR